VNDTPVQLANHDEMRRFTVPEGTVAVKMLYVPRMFYLGLYLSGLGWVTMTVLVKTNYLTRIFV
jgi:hypothetical protein